MSTALEAPARVTQEKPQTLGLPLTHSAIALTGYAKRGHAEACATNLADTGMHSSSITGSHQTLPGSPIRLNTCTVQTSSLELIFTGAQE